MTRMIHLSMFADCSDGMFFFCSSQAASGTSADNRAGLDYWLARKGGYEAQRQSAGSRYVSRRKGWLDRTMADQ
ncbi:MAG TPA: hypothetical protein VM659_26680 [Dongiaceae bacterium]|nr:hypothetical protein [Dongiaceae bacterium]